MRDYYYFHSSGGYAFGALDKWDANPPSFQFHSPCQIEAEFFGDLAELAKLRVLNLILRRRVITQYLARTAVTATIALFRLLGLAFANHRLCKSIRRMISRKSPHAFSMRRADWAFKQEICSSE